MTPGEWAFLTNIQSSGNLLVFNLLEGLKGKVTPEREESMVLR